MRSTKVILAVRYTAASVAGGAGRAVGGFLRYVQYRDHHNEPDPAPAGEDPDGFLRYLAHRDRSTGKGLLFDRDGTAGDAERRRLANFIERSTQGMPKVQPMGPDGPVADRRRAVYRLVISPEDARGLDLQRLTLAVVDRLEEDAGARLHWIAAEHRNTAHPHIHLVIAARREVAPGRYQTVMINRPRLARMKAALQQEMERQRGHERHRVSSAAVAAGVSAEHLERLIGPAGPSNDQARGTPLRGRRGTSRLASRSRRFIRRQRTQQVSSRRSQVLARIAAKYHREAERRAARDQGLFARGEEELERQ